MESVASDLGMWMVSSPTGTCYLARKDTGQIKWFAETNNELIYIACKGDDVTDYVDLKPQNEYNIRWLENDCQMYHFKNGKKQEIILPFETQEKTQQIMDLIYKDSYTKVDVKTHTYYFNHTSGAPCEERLSAFKVQRLDFYVHRASPAWSIRCSRLKAWFPAYGNDERYRLECVVFHARDSCKFLQACKRFNMMPPPEASPLNRFVLTSNLYETNKKIECLATGVVIAEGKHNMSIIEGTYDKVKAVVKKVRIVDDCTELKKKLRDACFHENLVAFLGCESDNVYNYYAYEEGGITLAQHITRHPYVEMDESSMKIITGLVQGVKHLHDQGLVHTNLNPWNILVKGSTTVKICGMSQCQYMVDAPDGKLKDLQDIAHVILYIVSKRMHLLNDVVAVNLGLVDENHLMNLVGTNAEVIDLLKKIGIVQLQKAQPSIYRITTIEDLMRQPFFWNAPRRLNFFTDLSNHLAEGNPTNALQIDIEAIICDVVDSKYVASIGRPSWQSKFTTLIKSMSNISLKNPKAGWKYADGLISSLIRLARNERSHSEETRSKAADMSNSLRGDYIVKGRELGTNDTEMEQKFRAKFPKLLTKLHDAARAHPIDILKKYYH